MSVRLPIGQTAPSASILVVDDEPDVDNLFRQRFRREARQGTYVMHFAASGAEALDQLAGQIQPTLIVDGWPGVAGRDQATLSQSAGHDGDRIW